MNLIASLQNIQFSGASAYIPGELKSLPESFCFTGLFFNVSDCLEDTAFVKLSQSYLLDRWSRYKSPLIATPAPLIIETKNKFEALRILLKYD